MWVQSWVGKIPWRRARQPTPVFLPGELHGQKSRWAMVPGVKKSWTRLKRLSMRAHPVCPEFCYSFMIRELTWGLGMGL